MITRLVLLIHLELVNLHFARFSCTCLTHTESHTWQFFLGILVLPKELEKRKDTNWQSNFLGFTFWKIPNNKHTKNARWKRYRYLPLYSKNKKWIYILQISQSLKKEWSLTQERQEIVSIIFIFQLMGDSDYPCWDQSGPTCTLQNLHTFKTAQKADGISWNTDSQTGATVQGNVFFNNYCHCQMLSKARFPVVFHTGPRVIRIGLSWVRHNKPTTNIFFFSCDCRIQIPV